VSYKPIPSHVHHDSSSIDGLKTISVGSLDKSSTLDFGSSIHHFLNALFLDLKPPSLFSVKD
ncbi:hypothetical protein, partial [Bacteroides uniformis]|uniref:hypothetical protein n=1 Tax=Bacteroides uniformis TaxID=820 RepID=UPI001AA146F9